MGKQLTEVKIPSTADWRWKACFLPANKKSQEIVFDCLHTQEKSTKKLQRTNKKKSVILICGEAMVICTKISEKMPQERKKLWGSVHMISFRLSSIS